MKLRLPGRKKPGLRNHSNRNNDKEKRNPAGK
jgi:hypothetical protein